MPRNRLCGCAQYCQVPPPKENAHNVGHRNRQERHTWCCHNQYPLPPLPFYSYLSPYNKTIKITNRNTSSFSSLILRIHPKINHGVTTRGQVPPSVSKCVQVRRIVLSLRLHVSIRGPTSTKAALCPCCATLQSHHNGSMCPRVPRRKKVFSLGYYRICSHRFNYSISLKKAL